MSTIILKHFCLKFNFKASNYFYSFIVLNKMGSDRETRIYVGNLPHDVTRRDVEDLFYKYGQIRDIDLKTRRTAFAFIEYYDARLVVL